MRYKTFDLAIQDGNGIMRYIIPISMSKDQTITDEFKKELYRFGGVRLYEQGYETYGMKVHIENQDENDYRGEYHYAGGVFESN